MDDDGLVDGTGSPEESLRVQYFDPIAAEWEPMTIVNRDLANNRVTFESDHFSTYLTEVIAKDPPEPDERPTDLVVGEYFLWEPTFRRLDDGTLALIESGCLNRQGRACASPWKLLLRYHEKEGLIAVLDRHASLNDSAGIRGEIAEDGKSAVFDSWEVSDKILESGDARNWQWEADFVEELTRLRNYRPISTENPYVEQVPEAQRLYAAIAAEDDRRVRITWGVNVFNELELGRTLCVAFEANYLGDGT